MSSVKQRPPLSERLKKGLEEGIQYSKGELELRSTTVEILDPAPDVKPADVVEIRRTFEMSQSTFAQTLNVSPKTVRSWEKGEQKPSRVARRLLQLIRSRPELISESVGSTGRPRANSRSDPARTSKARKLARISR